MTTSKYEQGAAAALVAIGVFRGALTLGMPFGQAACAGSQHATLPTRLRAINGLASLAYGTSAVITMRGSPTSGHNGWEFTRPDHGKLGLVQGRGIPYRKYLVVKRTSWSSGLAVTADGVGVVAHAGSVVLVLDLDAMVVIAHRENEQACPTFKKTFGCHPLGAWCDNAQEFLAAKLCPGNAGSKENPRPLQVAAQ
ncbi:MAG: hypothetical protein WBG57_08680, partial [Ornithinimicrobium sp.]